MNEVKVNFFAKVGIPGQLAWGYVGILIFMMGDGMEQGWLSPYLIENGLTMQRSAMLFSAYGIIIAIASWFSGVMAEAYGIKKTMFTGLILYLFGTVSFVGYALPGMNFTVMLLTYALRGFGYPLFAYSFLVWIAYVSPGKSLGRAVGWFWFVFTGGLVVLGAYYSSWAIPRIGYINTLWNAVIWVLVGAFFVLVLTKERKRAVQGEFRSRMREVAKGFFALYGFTTTEWLQIWGTIFTSNIIFNLIFGFIGDSLGWRNTIIWFGGVGCAVSTLLFYYSPQLFGDSFIAVMIAGIIWGAMLAGYVPLSALVPSLVKNDKGAAMSILNLGAGLPVFVGPAVVGLFIGLVGSTGVIWILALLYLISALLTKFITLPNNAKTLKHLDSGNMDH
ncbi:MFS transporter [uncultured Proteiniphilum sp.]|uniref:MFS transporter n=1 Tax=uncultured Proteiniphilum sp. TaxID=497637 RepID=UPI002639B0A1|nr:MFS transporter [uncultured Proteiniphilum sp.]